MNILFVFLFVLCAAQLCFSAPQQFLPALLSSASGAASLCVALLSSYAVFGGLSALWEDSGLTNALAKRLKKPVCKFFKTDNEEAAECVCMNVAANLLGLGAIATPYGVKAARLLDGEDEKTPRKIISAAPQKKPTNAVYSLSMLFALNAASLQLVPSSVIALRTAAGSAAPSSVVLPIFLVSVFFCVLEIFFTRLIYKKNPPEKSGFHRGKKRRFKRGETSAAAEATA